MIFTVGSWNMNQRCQAWARAEHLVATHRVLAFPVQEAKPPSAVPAGWAVHPDPGDAGAWRIPVPTNTRRWYRSAMAVTDAGLQYRARQPKPLADAADGEFACSHPGQFAVVEFLLATCRLTVISFYGIWDRMWDSGRIYPEATLHRAISDLTVVFQEEGADHVLVAGDLNVYSYSDGSEWGDRGMTVLDRFARYGLEIIGPYRPEGEARLERCPCPDVACRCVNTFLYRSDPANRPHQLDFFLATPALRARLQQCWADPDPAWPSYSDHRPIFATFDL
ncbi:MAG: hypothetical protein ACRDZ7_00705 [Acidimicrobiia bacterium]